jgi:hypothetical protein
MGLETIIVHESSFSATISSPQFCDQTTLLRIMGFAAVQKVTPSRVS